MDWKKTELMGEIVSDLTAELSISDSQFNPNLLASKVKGALSEVEQTRRYPESYTEEKILADMTKFYSNIRNIALYDYNKIGIEFEESHAENNNTLKFESRNSLFSGVIPLARV